MGLFDQILSAVNDPAQQGSTNQLAGTLGAIQQISQGQGVNASATQAAMSIVGQYVRSALQQKRTESGEASAQAIVNQYSGTEPNSQAVESLFSPNQQQQVAQAAAQRAGIDSSTVQALLPILVPLVLNLLQSGANNSNPQQGGNSVLNTFLDSDRDGDVDVGDVMGLASQFLNRPH